MSEKTNRNVKTDELLKSAVAGDDKAMAELIEIITPLAYARASKLNFGTSRISDEDLVQEGMIGFIHAIRTYKEDSEASFETYAAKCIENRILSALRTYNNSGNVALSGAVSIDENIDESAVSGQDPAFLAESGAENERIRKIANDKLSDFESKVFFMRLNDLSYTEIAEKLGCNQKAIDNALVRIRSKLRDLI